MFRISNVANVAYDTGLALFGASRHPNDIFSTALQVFPHSVAKPTFSKSVSRLCPLC